VTAAAVTQARSIAAALRVTVAGLEVAMKIVIEVRIDEQPASATAFPLTTLTWIGQR